MKSPGLRPPPALLRAAGVYAALGGLLSLCGWLFDVPRLTDWTGSGISIQPNACLATAAAGFALIAFARGKQRFVAPLGALCALIGAAALFEHLTGIDLGLDRALLFGHGWGRSGVVAPGLMGPMGSSCWTLLGSALVLVTRPGGSPARATAVAIALLTASISALGLIGYLYGASTLYSLPHSTVIALQTASFVLLSSLGVIATVPEHIPMRLIASRERGGSFARRLLPSILLVPILIGLLRVIGERRNYYDGPFGSALRTLLEMLLLAILVGVTTVAIDRHARQRAAADETSRAIRKQLEQSRLQLEAELRDTRLLQSVSTELFAHEDADSLFASLLEAATQIMRSDFASIQLLRVHARRGRSLELLAHRGFTAEAAKLWREVLASTGCVCGQALLRGTRVIVSDLNASDFGIDAESLAGYQSLGIRAVQTTPLVSRNGALLGMISTHWRTPYEPSERELRSFDILARQAADAIERDEAERQRAELFDKERNARGDAERAARLKDEFLATLSHELRTPLNAVIGWAQILKRDVSNLDKVRSAVDVIERNGRLQAKLITDLLDISRIVSGNMRLELQAVELATVVDAAIESIQPVAEAKSVRILKQLEPQPQPLSGDPARLQQVVWNLLSNAVKFTPSGGEVEVSLAKHGAHVELTIKDSGEGITPELLPHIFERFRQGDASTSRRHGGLGLGLAIVKQLIELHKGSVRASSPGSGRGSSFVVKLPLVPLDEEDSTPSSFAAKLRSKSGETAKLGLTGARVLVVDDEPDALTMVGQLLAEHGAQVVTASSAAAALERLKTSEFDVIVSDLGMPVMDGYALIAEIRRRDIRTPAMALTAFARSEDRGRALAAGYQAHLPKPLEAHELIAAVASLSRRAVA